MLRLRRRPLLREPEDQSVLVVPAPRQARRPAGPDGALEAAASTTVTAKALTTASQEVSGNVEEVATAITELQASISDIAGDASRAASVASVAVQHAATATGRVTTLQEATQVVGGIVELITSITAQSRLLALNATIEAARAGEAGRGFAVVATEVKQLADKTAQAAEQIAGQLAAVQAETLAAVADIGLIAGTIDEVFRAQGLIAAAVEQQSAAARRISQHVDLAAAGSGRISVSVAELARSQQLSFVRTALAAARGLLDDRGGLHLGAAPVTWAARNQLTGTTVHVQLPQLCIDGQWLEQNDDPRRRTPFVDEVAALVGGTNTVFQRLNEAGDMLRVATDVPTAQGRRNIGTYIPVVDADGQPTPVLAQVLTGQTYLGEAVVADRAYFTAYHPIAADTGEVIGMLYVGLPT